MTSRAARCLLCSVCVLIFVFGGNESQLITTKDVVFIVLSQSNTYHNARARLFRSNIIDQATNLNMPIPTVILLHERWLNAGAWTVLPIIPSLASEFGDGLKAVLFCDEESRVDLVRLIDSLRLLDLSKELFLGRPLRDSDASIIHHFAFHDNPSRFAYPDLSACFMMTYPLVVRLSKQMKNSSPRSDFSIDASHELAVFVWNNDAGFRLTEVSFFCGFIKNDRDSKCATWRSLNFPNCDEMVVDESEVFIAVKTCQKYHSDRLSVVKGTWAKESKHINYFSDVGDSSIPTITLGIPNTERGHCAKLLAILQYAYNLLDIHHYQWIMVVDDDTLVSVDRLKRLLSCYNSSEYVAIGERYGYGVQLVGYNYITLGGGMVLSSAVLRRVIESKTCICAAPDSPDDMTFGLCLKHLNIAITHSPHFHQARPDDYSVDYLNNYLPVTFHRHWMSDPYRVYKEWLSSDSDKRTRTHDDL